MRRFLLPKQLMCIFLLTFLLAGISETSFADVILGTIKTIEGTRISVENDAERITVTAKSLEDMEMVSIGDNVEILYYPVADTLVAEEIKIVQQR